MRAEAYQQKKSFSVINQVALKEVGARYSVGDVRSDPEDKME